MNAFLVMSFLTAVFWAVSLAGLFAAAVVDFRSRTIPNRLVLLTAGCGVAVRLLSDPRSIWQNIAAAVTVMLVLGFLAHHNWVGAGDAKLMAAVTLLVPPDRILALLLAIAIAGGLLSIIYLIAQLVLRRHEFARFAANRKRHISYRWSASLPDESAAISGCKSVPYALAIFAGTATLALAEVMRWFYATS